MRERSGRRVRCRALAALAVLVFLPATAGESILYYVKDGAVVFTNTPSRRDARPVPGLEEIRLALPGNLPDTPYDRFIRVVATEEGLDPSLIKAVALVESGFNPKAVSPKGARGLMQLMPATARLYGVRDLHDPYENLRAGTRHLRDLLLEFKGDVPLALAAYNAGSGAVKRYGGIPAYRETRDYVSRVTSRLGQSPHRAKLPSAPPSRELVVERNPDGTIKASN